MTDDDLETPQRMAKLEKALSRLHGVEAEGWDGTLANAEQRLRDAAEKLIAAAEGPEGRGSKAAIEAEAEFEGWSKVISTHPAYIKRERRQVKEWEADNFDKCQAALYELRPLIPPDIARSSLAATQAHPALQRGNRPNKKLAERIFRKRVLWLLRSSPAELASMHIADLCGPQYSGNARIENVRKSQSCMVSKLRMI